MRLVLLYSSPRFCIRVIVGIEISVGEENKQGEKGEQEKERQEEDKSHLTQWRI